MIGAIGDRVHSYCQAPQPKEKAETLVADLFRAVTEAAPLQRCQLIDRIRQELNRKGVQEGRKALFKKAIGGNWKNHAFEKKIDLEFPPFLYKNDLKIPITLETRSKTLVASPFSLTYGSTFATNKPERISRQDSHLLDACFAANCLDRGYVMAIADGAGGHFGDPRQDENIAKAAHAACKASVSLFSAYENPDTLLKDLPELAKLIGKEVQRKGRGESTTLVACRAFPCQEGFRLIGFNVGDGMLLALQGETLQTLLPAHVANEGTALFPASYKPFEFYTLDCLIPEGSRLFLMTDGVHDMLPFTEVEDLHYRKREIAPLGGANLLMSCIANAEKKRLETQLPDQQIGDDFTLLACILNKV
jgi:serine/threonine protein phosphatase PrpC